MTAMKHILTILTLCVCSVYGMKAQGLKQQGNFNKPILAIYLKASDGKYRLYKKFENVIPGNENEFHSVSHSLEITNRGTVRITIEHFSSGGGYGSETTTYTFRMQEGEFYLIGRVSATPARAKR